MFKSPTMLFLAAVLMFLIPINIAYADDQGQGDSPLAELAWQTGPSTARIGNQADIKLDEQLIFLDDDESEKFMAMTGNLSGDEEYVLMHAENQWWAVFSFDDIGYVKDNEEIDGDALLATLKESDEPANEMRAEYGMGALYTVGWSTQPHYDRDTNQLEWGLKLRDETNEETLNYTVRLLGRHGVINATLVTDESSFERDISEFRASLNNFQFQDGKRYAQYVEGDRIAEVGLAALVLGGAAALASKKGFWAAIALFFAKFWKFILIGFAAVGAGFKNIFKKKKAEE